MKKLNSVFSNKNNNTNVSNDTLVFNKSKFSKYIRHIASIFALCLIVLFSSCSSVPTVNYVHPVDLLDNQSGFYLAIPKKSDKDLIPRMISKYIPELSEKDIKTISDRTDSIYCGINRNKRGTEIQAAIEGNIPLSFVPRILTKKHGWVTRKFNNKDITHTIYTLNGIDVSFPSSSIVLIGRNIEHMLTRYDYLSNIPISASDEPEISAPIINDNKTFFNNNDMVNIHEVIQDYLKGANTDIRFYANKPASFLALLTGTNLDLKLTEVSGSFRPDPESDIQYLLDIYLNFKETKFLKAGRAILGLAFGLTGADTTIVGDKQQLYKILAI